MNFITRILTPKNDILRHRILEILHYKILGTPKRTLLTKDIAVTIDAIAEKLEQTPETIHHVAFGFEEEEVKFDDLGNGICLHASTDTMNAFTTEKYLTKGRTHILNRLKDYLGITTAIIAIITTIISVIVATRSITNNQERIKALEKEVRLLKGQSGQSNPSK